MALPNTKSVVSAIHVVLVGSSSITDLVGTYKTAPCVFTGHTVPSAADRPYIHIKPPVGFIDQGTKDIDGMEVTIEILVVSNKDDSAVTAYDLADGALELLNRQSLTISGDNHLLTECVGMATAQSSNDLNAILITLNVLVMD